MSGLEEGGGGAAQHSGSKLASRPEATDSILSITKYFSFDVPEIY